MQIFSTKGAKLVEITEEQFPLEREIQRLTEANLQELFDLVLVRSEFELHGLRIDTLAFNKESSGFVIIEYKKDRNFSVVDQGVGIQLWEVHKYSNGFLVFNEAKSPFTREPITSIAKSNPIAKKVTEEIKVYTEEDHLIGVDDNVKELYSELKSAILVLGNDIEMSQRKSMLLFVVSKHL